jgi:hypothetical protein
VTTTTAPTRKLAADIRAGNPSRGLMRRLLAVAAMLAGAVAGAGRAARRPASRRHSVAIAPTTHSVDSGMP